MNTDIDHELRRGYEALEEENYQAARVAFERAMLGGASEAALHLGWLNDKGLGGAQDDAEAARLYQAAYLHNRQLGAFYLGSLLLRQGKLLEAKPLFEEAAKLNHPSAAYWAYVLNADDPQSQASGRLYLKMASQLGHFFACRDLARLEMREARSPATWLAALIRYVGFKLRGVLVAFRDIEDSRIR